MTRVLPDFTNPPVVEVALSVQFEPLSNLRTPQAGLLWSQFRAQFPKIEEHPTLNSVIEKFGVHRSRPVGIRIEMENKPPMPRCWFLNTSGTELIQVQQDRFVHNWRKVGEGDKYPRYESVRDKIKKELNSFSQFLCHENVGEFIPNQCEITYVNHIRIGTEWQNHGQLGEVLTLFTPTYSEPFLPDAEDARVRVRYVVTGKDNQPLGRLHLSVEPGYWKADDEPMLVMTLTARGRPIGEGIDGIMQFFDIGREWIVRGFASVTTAQMHRAWGRKQ